MSAAANDAHLKWRQGISIDRSRLHQFAGAAVRVSQQTERMADLVVWSAARARPIVTVTIHRDRAAARPTLASLSAMSLDFYFHVETRASGEWTCPGEFPETTTPGVPRGEFTWIKGSSWAQGLFFGERALFPFRLEPPPFTAASELFRTLYPEGWTVEDRGLVLSWIPYEELMVDLWDETRLLVENRVPAKYGALFGDGTASFPEAALAAAGWEQHLIDGLREGSPAIEAIPRSHGPGRHEVETSDPRRLLDVTWTDTVTGCVRPWRADAFRSLRRYGTDAELRVISIFW